MIKRLFPFYGYFKNFIFENYEFCMLAQNAFQDIVQYDCIIIQ